MTTKRSIFLTICWVILYQGISIGAVMPNWRVDLKEIAIVKGSIVTLSDLTDAPLPAGLGKLVIVAGGKPGTVKSVSNKMILRKLVTNGLSSGVSFTGPQWSQVEFTGAETTAEELRPRIRGIIQAMVPVSVEGAPGSWFELILPEVSFSFQTDLALTCPGPKTLVPGRNTIRIRFQDGNNKRDIQVIVNFHAFDEVATALVEIPKDAALNAKDFHWQWEDMAHVDQGIIVGRESLSASSAARNIKTGHKLRVADLKIIPVILAGDRVDLCINRGSLEVVVKGVARQAGSLGQVIPVRNILNGRLVNATVSGPGIVQWRN